MKRILGASYIILLSSLPCFSQDTSLCCQSTGITLSLPWVNNYSYHNYESKRSATKSGFVGLGASAFYKTGKHKFSLNFAITGDLPVPIGAFDYGKEGSRSNIHGELWELIYHRSIFNKVNLIGGINIVKYRYSFTSYVNQPVLFYSIDDKTTGLTLGAEYLYARNSMIAVFYRPAILSAGKKEYRHLISADARFDIHFWRRK